MDRGEVENIVVWVADVGSVKKGNFAWCRMESKGVFDTGSDIAALAIGVAADLSAGHQVALGFECPLYIPVTREPEALSRQRLVDDGHPWCAGAGATVLALGVAESAWVFARLKEADVAVMPTFRWPEFTAGPANLFIWEAFVTGAAKGKKTHEEDAEKAARAFWTRLGDSGSLRSQPEESPLSLVGAALLQSGLSRDLALLTEACVVVGS